MSLPIVIIFERHWDPVPKAVVRDLLPDLRKRGYGTLCFEVPPNLSSAEIRERHARGLELDTRLHEQAEQFLRRVGITEKLSEMSFGRLAELSMLYVSSKKYIDVAEKIKQLPASALLQEVFKEAATLSFSVKGVDVEGSDYDEIWSPELDVCTRMSVIRPKEDCRITAFFQNLLKLRAECEEGVVFVCGALHASRLVDEFKRRGLHEEVLYYFPHSFRRYNESVDDINQALMNDTLVEHTHLLSEKDVKPLSARIIEEITRKTRYQREVHEDNSHIQFLSECFKTHVRAFLRPGCHLDALVELAEASEGIPHRLAAAGVPTYPLALEGRSYVVIPNVNTRDIADRVRKS